MSIETKLDAILYRLNWIEKALIDGVCKGNCGNPYTHTYTLPCGHCTCGKMKPVMHATVNTASGSCITKKG